MTGDTLPSSGTTLISWWMAKSLPVSVDVQSVTDGVQVQVGRIPDGVAEYSVWGHEGCPSLRQHLFRCVAVRKRRRNGVPSPPYSVLPERVHRGQQDVRSATRNDSRHRSPGDATHPDHRNSGGGRDNIRYWRAGTHREVVKGVSFSLRLNVAAEMAVTGW
ncbi:hypothetical protein KCP75_01670 [Salmonella enterica subsp. enterica]|nr:hypothetical protein KCP75_01670 [Salmonella enterica subsp. enterica]